VNSAPVGLKEWLTEARIGAFEGARFAGIETVNAKRTTENN
jgi:hypothetical protein